MSVAKQVLDWKDNKIVSAKVALITGVMERVAGAIEKRADKSDAELIDMVRRARAVAPIPRIRRLLESLIDLMENNHPALQIFRRILKLHPNYRRKVITSLLGNCVLCGAAKRKVAFKRHGCDPFLMVISPTMKCNLRCLGCYAGNYPRDGKDPLSFEVLDRAVTEAKRLGMYFFTISGGEPFMRRDLLDLYEKHNDATFLIYTNGTLIDDEAISRMLASGNVAPAISVEGLAETTNARRGEYLGRPVFDIIMETMDRLQDAGIMFGFSGTAMRTNAEQYLRQEFYDLMVEKGALFGWLFIFVPVGQDDTIDLMVTAEQRDKLRDNVLEIRRKYPLFVADFWNDGCLTGGCMSGGTTYFHINYRGDIEPCVFMHFATHNIIELYENNGHLWDVLESPFFKAVRERNRKTNPLRPCPIIDHGTHLKEAVELTGARGTHKGAERVITELFGPLAAWSAGYAPFAEQAWNSGKYNWAQEGKNPFTQTD